MAKIRGKAGRYTGEEAARLRRRYLLLVCVMMGVLGFGEGVTLSSLWAKFHPPGWLTTSVQWGGMIGIGVLARWGWVKMDEWEAERIKWQKGDEGEKAVGEILASLSDDYEVINDIKVPGQRANLDHVVVGPTGVFVVDAKNWRGLVQTDGRGELLVNGEPKSDGSIRQFVARYMAVRKIVCDLAPGTEPYLQGLYVFTTAWVDVGWGQTGKVNCLHEGRLRTYIEEDWFDERIAPEDVKKIADAFWKVAQIDPDFTDKATDAIGHHRLSSVEVAQSAKA